ncbi:MAG: hypothetical protein R6V12_04485 [Candidatus Hydrogenedentota bacterium]
MKHLNYVSKQTPVHANILESLKDHPNIVQSILGLVTAPLETVRLHLNK